MMAHTLALSTVQCKELVVLSYSRSNAKVPSEAVKPSKQKRRSEEWGNHGILARPTRHNSLPIHLATHTQAHRVPFAGGNGGETHAYAFDILI